MPLTLVLFGFAAFFTGGVVAADNGARLEAKHHDQPAIYVAVAHDEIDNNNV
jgi:hypothetical protein